MRKKEEVKARRIIESTYMRLSPWVTDLRKQLHITPIKEGQNGCYCAYACPSLYPAPNTLSLLLRKIDQKDTRWRRSYPERRTNRPQTYCKCWPHCRQGIFHSLPLRNIQHKVIPYSENGKSTPMHRKGPNATKVSSSTPAVFRSCPWHASLIVLASPERRMVATCQTSSWSRQPP